MLIKCKNLEEFTHDLIACIFFFKFPSCTSFPCFPAAIFSFIMTVGHRSKCTSYYVEDAYEHREKSLQDIVNSLMYTLPARKQVRSSFRAAIDSSTSITKATKSILALFSPPVLKIRINREHVQSTSQLVSAAKNNRKSRRSVDNIKPLSAYDN